MGQESQVAHLDTASRLSDADLLRALNAVLDADVAILELRRVEDDFNARGDALLKQYVYRILTRRPSSPLRRPRPGPSWRPPRIAWRVG